MSDDLNPTGPSQPTQSQAYTTAGNPASHNPAEAATARATHSANQDAPSVDQRIPRAQAGEDEAKASALGRGVRGAGPGEEAKGLSEEDVGRHRELEGEQMAAPGEGRVYDAVAHKRGSGASGSQEDLAADLDRKKAEQAPAREAIKEERSHNVDVGGILGQRGGPANPVGKDNYPNTSD